jgi:hypothetical protein
MGVLYLKKATPVDEHLQRKIDLVLSVSGKGNDQVNVLINTLMHVTLMNDLDVARVISGFLESYLLNRPLYEYEDDYDNEDND